MRRVLLIAAILIVALPVLVVLAAGIIVSHPRTAAKLETMASEALGRPVKIGALDLEPGLTVKLTAHGLSVGEPEWHGEGDMAAVESATVSLDLWQSLINWHPVLPEIVVRQAFVSLSRDAEGKANWVFGGAEEDEAREPLSLPEIHRLVIEDSRLKLADEQNRLQLDAGINTVRGRETGDDGLNLAGSGSLNGQEADISIEAGSAADLFSGADYPVVLQAVLGSTTLDLDGIIAAPFEDLAVDAQLTLAGDDPQTLLDALYLPAPSLPPYSLTGRLTGSGGIWTLDGFDAVLGDSDLRGTLAVDSTEEPPFVSADFEAELLDIDDLGGLIGLPPSTGEGETASAGQEAEAEQYEKSGKLLPNPKIQPGRWDTVDADVALEAVRIEAPDLPLDDVSLAMTLRDGVMRLEPLQVALAGGGATLWMTLDTLAEPVRVDIDLRSEGVHLGRFFIAQETDPEAIGALSGRLLLTGRGEDLNQVLATGDGGLSFSMEAGRIDALMLELLGLDIAESLALVASEGEADTDAKSNIRCVVGRFDITGGLMESRSLLIDTTDSKILGEGTIGLTDESLDLTLTSSAKDASLLSGASPVTISGTFREPAVGVEAGPLAAQGIASLTLGALLTPLAAVIPFIDLGLAEDSPCAALIGEARQAE